MSATANLTKKALLKKSSEGVNNLFKLTKSTHPRQATTVRIDHKVKITKPNHVFYVNAAIVFNNLPNELKDPGLTETQFKAKLKVQSKSSYLLPKH